jgi:RND family efflux transporter MFP subunit
LDETHLTEVTARFRGWIEKLYADSTGQPVRQGEPLFEIYSPELCAAETDYLQAMEQGTNMTGMTGARSRTAARLKLFDLSDEQIAKLERGHEVRRTMTVLAPASGFVIEKTVVQGRMVEAGEKLYRIADLGTVWLQAQVYEQDLPFIKLGQEADVTLPYLLDRKFRGRVAYIYPTVDEKMRTVKVRMEFHNPGNLLKPGMFATVETHAELEPDALLVPESAVLRSSRNNTVFVVREDGKFEPRAVILGARGENGMCQVLGGLNVGERVVTSGQFLLDSESQSQQAIQRMSNPDATNIPMPVITERPSTNSNAPTETKVVYICPAPEHVAIRYDHSGKCPLCSLTLVPISEATYNKTVEENWHKEHPEQL